MRFLIDVSASSRSLGASLTDLGHDVVSVRDRDAGAADEVLLALAYEEKRVLVTEDKDFRELIFVRRLPHPHIVRFVQMRVVEKVAAIRELIERHADGLREGAIIVVTRGRMRVRFEGRDGRGKRDGSLAQDCDAARGGARRPVVQPGRVRHSA